MLKPKHLFIVILVLTVVFAVLYYHALLQPDTSARRVDSVDAEGIVRVNSMGSISPGWVLNPYLEVHPRIVNLTIRGPTEDDDVEGHLSQYLQFEDIEWISLVDRESGQVVKSYFQPHYGWEMPYDGSNFTITVDNVDLYWMSYSETRVQFYTSSDIQGRAIALRARGGLSYYSFQFGSLASNIDVSLPATTFAIWAKISPTEYEPIADIYPGSHYIMRLESSGGSARFRTIGNHSVLFDESAEIEFRTDDDLLFYDSFGTVKLVPHRLAEGEGSSELTFQGNRMEWLPASSEGYPRTSTFVIRSHSNQGFEVEIYGIDGRILRDNVDSTRIQFAGPNPALVGLFQGLFSIFLVVATLVGHKAYLERNISPEATRVEEEEINHE